MMNDNITLIWMGFLSLCFLYVYMRLRRIESLLKCEQDNTILKPELTTFNNFLLYVVLSDLSYKRQKYREMFFLLILVIIFGILLILSHFNTPKEIFVMVYTILFILVIIFNRKMMNEVIIEKYIDIMFERKAEDIKRNPYNYKKMISLEKDTFPLIALLFSTGICLLKGVEVVLSVGHPIDGADVITYLCVYSILIYLICIVYPNYIYISLCSTKIKDILDEK